MVPLERKGCKVRRESCTYRVYIYSRDIDVQVYDDIDEYIILVVLDVPWVYLGRRGLLSCSGGTMVSDFTYVFCPSTGDSCV